MNKNMDMKISNFSRYLCKLVILCTALSANTVLSHGNIKHQVLEQQSCSGDSCIKAEFIPPSDNEIANEYEKIVYECVSQVDKSGVNKVRLLSGLGDSQYPLVSLIDKNIDDDKISSELFNGSHPVQAYYSQGMVLQYGFNFPRAIRSFYKATLIDDDAAMAYWGIALSANSNINSNATNGCDRLAYASANRALKRAKAQRESNQYKKLFSEYELQRQLDYINAFNSLYIPTGDGHITITQQSKLNYAAKMKLVAKTYIQDLDAATLYADSLLNIDPWKWWEGVIETSDDVKPTIEAAIALEVLNKVLIQDPQHIGANHFFIHAIEESPYSDSGIPMAERLKSLVPASGHLVHMTSHIYQRIGDNAQSSAANYRAVQVDKAYMSEVKEDDAYPLHYLGHNIHFLTWTLSIEGRENDSITMARELVNNTIDYSSDKYMCTHFTEEIKVKTDYFFAAAIYFAVRFQNAAFLSEMITRIYGEEEKGGDADNGGWRSINSMCKKHNGDWVNIDIPYTKMITSYALASGLLHTPLIPPFAFIAEGMGLDLMRTFWNISAEEFEQYPNMQYGNNNAIELIQIANIQLVTQWLNTRTGQKGGLALLQDEMEFLDKGVTSPLYDDIFCTSDSSDCSAWKNKSSDENIIRLWEQAVDVQDALNYNEPPDWYYTSREALAYAYLKNARETKNKEDKQKAAAQAENIFQQDLYNNRKSGRSICGLMQSLQIQSKNIPLALKEDFKTSWMNANISANMNLALGEQALLKQIKLMGSECILLKK